MGLSCRNERDNTGIFQGAQPRESRVAQVLGIFYPLSSKLETTVINWPRVVRLWKYYTKRDQHEELEIIVGKFLVADRYFEVMRSGPQKLDSVLSVFLQ